MVLLHLTDERRQRSEDRANRPKISKTWFAVKGIGLKVKGFGSNNSKL
jgi:hypothetical protein